MSSCQVLVRAFCRHCLIFPTTQWGNQPLSASPLYRWVSAEQHDFLKVRVVGGSRTWIWTGASVSPAKSAIVLRMSLLLLATVCSPHVSPPWGPEIGHILRDGTDKALPLLGGICWFCPSQGAGREGNSSFVALLLSFKVADFTEPALETWSMLTDMLLSFSVS